MKIRTDIVLILPLLFVMWGCDPETTTHDVAGLFYGSSPRADSRFEDSQEYNRQHGVDTIRALDENYHVYVCTDTHIMDSRTNWEYFIAAYHADSSCPVAIHVGDLINAQKHWEYMYAAFAEVPKPADKKDTLFVSPGNHDIYFDQWSCFRQYFHTSSYYFLVQTPSGKLDFYLIIDSAEGCLGEKQLAWLKQILSWADKQPFRHRMVATHTHPFMEDASQELTSNYPLEETYELVDLFGSHHVEFYLCGHDHYRDVTRFGGCTYIVLDALQDKQENAGYMVMDVSSTVNYDFVSVIRK